MAQIDTGDSILTLLDDRVVIVETKAGVVLDKQAIRRFYDVVEQRMPGEYSLVIDRKHNYRLMRFEVYAVANSQERLKGIAVVVYNKSAGKMAEIEAPLASKPFAQFTDVDDAVVWARELHSN